MQLNEKEIDILVQAFGVITHAYGANQFEAQCGKGSVDKLENLRRKLPLSGIIEKEDLKAVANYFAVAREIIDPIEFPILTSYSWDESGDLLAKFQSELDGRP